MEDGNDVLTEMIGPRRLRQALSRRCSVLFPLPGKRILTSLQNIPNAVACRHRSMRAALRSRVRIWPQDGTYARSTPVLMVPASRARLWHAAAHWRLLRTPAGMRDGWRHRQGYRHQGGGCGRMPVPAGGNGRRVGRREGLLRVKPDRSTGSSGRAD